MKALLIRDYGGPDRLELADVPEPEPGPGEVLVTVGAASLNPIDWKMREGEVRRFFEFEFPHVLGRDFSGVVEAAGPDVADVTAGDGVFGVCNPTRWGSHADKVAVDAGLVAAKPAALDHAQTVALGVSAMTVVAALETTAPVARGSRVLIHAGAGGVGHLAIQYAAHKGAHVVTTASAANHDFVRAQGAAEAIDYTTEDFVAAAGPCDLVFDTVGGEVHRRSLEALKPGGTLVYINAEPIPEDAARDDVTVVNAPVRGGRAGLGRIAELAAEGAFKPVVTERFALADYAQAYARIETGHTRGKIVFEMG